MDRYTRQTIIPAFGEEAQKLLKQAKVLVIGAGGLGCPVIANLASAGLGTIGILDFDTIQLSNLNRQFLYHQKDLGNSKVETAAKWIESFNMDIKVKKHELLLTEDNAGQIIDQYECIVDCTDSFFTRYLISDTSFKLKKILIYGAVFRFEGQVAVFDYSSADEQTISYRDLFPEEPLNPELTDCATAGVLGTSTALIGTLQSNEVIKCITGIGDLLTNQLLICSLSDSVFRTIKLKKRSIAKKDYFGFQATNWGSLRNMRLENYVLIDCGQSKQKKEGFETIHLANEEAIHFVHDLNDSKKIVITCEQGNKSLWLAKLMQEAGVENEILLVKGGNRSLEIK